MKKLLSLLFVFCLVLSTTAVSSSAAEIDTGFVLYSYPFANGENLVVVYETSVH